VSASRVSAAALERFSRDVLIACGVSGPDAMVAARALGYADRRGLDTHGVANLERIYVPRLLAGTVAPRAVPRIVAERQGFAVLDGMGGLGLVVATRAMEDAVERARRHGMGLVGVRGSSHFGCAGHYATLAARRGMLGVAATNLGAQALVPPPGARTRLLGTNPLAIAAPAGRLPAFVLDMSTTAVSAGKVRAAARAGRPVPEGWLADDAGRPVTDPARYEAGAAELQWLGGTKGFGLGLAIELLCGALPGRAAPFGEADDDDAVGHVLLAVDVAACRPLADFRAEVDALLGAVLDAEPGPGRPAVRYPGHPEAEVREDRDARGVPVDDELSASLARVGARLGVALPRPQAEALAR
jgi:LDH2 family malate/lactate/ureidoglycolate dehydrogenase